MGFCPDSTGAIMATAPPAVRQQFKREEFRMKRISLAATVSMLAVAVWLLAQPAGDPLIESFRDVEAASAPDAMEQLYRQKSYLTTGTRPPFLPKSAPPPPPHPSP